MYIQWCAENYKRARKLIFHLLVWFLHNFVVNSSLYSEVNEWIPTYVY